MKPPPTHAELVRQAASLIEDGQAKAAERLLKGVLRDNPDQADALVVMGVLCGMRGQLADAVKHLARAARRAPDSDAAHYNLGQALIRQNRYEEAAEALTRARELSDRAEVHEKLGDCLSRLDRLEQSIASYARAVELAPGNSLALSSLIEAKRRVCDWSGLDRYEADLVALAAAGQLVEPLLLLHVADDPALQARVAQRYWRDMIAPSLPPPEHSSRPRTDARRPDGSRQGDAGSKIRIGYVSADFRRHPMASVIAEVIELHDRTRFEVHGFSYGQDDRSPERRRLAAAFDRFHDVAASATPQIAKQIQKAGIDILIDLAGYTANARLGIVGTRPAPVTCHYMGYPGSIGSDAIDYLIGDPVVTPDGAQAHYTEALVRLPDSYWGIDRKRPVEDGRPSRSAHGLPDDAVVLASFNGQQKLTPWLFDVWARILSAAPDAVLWLYSDHAAAVPRLRAEAQKRGIQANRLILADRVPQPQHLARLRTADLALDTMPYGGHTTTADALWMGLPVITVTGRSFAARVGPSLLRAADLPQLAVASLDAYEQEATRLAVTPDDLAALAARLASSRDRCALFDTARFTAHLEAGYTGMWQRHRRGEQPAGFDV